MKKKSKDRNKKGGWKKAILGFILLSWKLFNKKEPFQIKEKKWKNKKRIQQNVINAINTPKPMEKDTEKEMDKERKGWLKAQPEELPSPTYWPFFLALGLAFLFWGIITSWVIVVVGLLIFIIALAGWINILRHE